MATPKQFKDTKSIEYAISASSAGVYDYINIKDYFRSMVVRSDIFAQDTVFTSYTIQNGERPDQVSWKEYGDEQFYWIILQVNGITDYYNQWPLSEYELEEFIIKKYGSAAGAGQVHHWETVETYDEDGNLVLPGGLVVPEGFAFSYYSTPTENVQLVSRPIEVTNSQYEKALNSDKEEIMILDRKYIYDYVREYKQYTKKAPAQKSEVNISELS